MSIISSNDLKTNPVLVFDGTCILCDSFFQWVTKKDKRKIFRYGTLQSGYGKDLIGRQTIETGADTVILIHQGKFFTYSSAALRTLILLGGFPKLLGYTGFIFPKFIRDSVYRFIAKKRYKWFGTKSCLIPGPEWGDRFN